jgi:ABC-type glycerol-3-phosphate transport system substrate-binding protein
MKKRTLSVLSFVFLLVAGSLASCGDQPGSGSSAVSGGSDSGVSDSQTEPATDLTIFMNEGNQFEGREKDSIMAEIEKKTNVNLNIEGATVNDDYFTTLNAMINTGDIPDICFYYPNNTYATSYNSLLKQDVFWNIDELTAQKPGQYPHVEAIFKSQQYKNITYGDSEHTLLPVMTSASGWGIYYRSDWLINIGYYTTVNGVKKAKAPETIEEFQDVMKKFTLNDPDGNGAADTYAISPGNGTYFLNPLYHAFGVPTDYDIDENNEATYMQISPKFKTFLTWFAQMESNGYVDPQWPTNSNFQDREKFTGGKIGILITNALQHVLWVATPFEQANGKDKLIMGPAPKGTANLGVEGAQGFSNWGGTWGGYSISKSCKDPFAALRFLDFVYSQEGTDLREYGIEGVHYDIVNGEKVPNLVNRNKEPEGTFLMINDENGVSQPSGAYKFGSNLNSDLIWNGDDVQTRFVPKNLDSAHADLIQQGIDYNTLYTSKLVNVTGYYSTYTTKMSKFQDTTETYAVNVITGKKNVTTDWDAMLETIKGSTIDWPGIKKMIETIAKKDGIIS